jgi:hypothetical protein
MRKGKDPDPGGPKTCGSGSPTLVISIGKRFPGAQDPAHKSAEPVPSTGGAGSQDVPAGGQGGGQAA